ncbi:transposase family protein [Leptospira noguchii]|uniref:Transposase family protein n=1 Tax=Leptospira noguchii TaxID=28182 RepID=A0AAE9K7W0_9LEPT|nr:transposase family protein [Leptospira noguchii]UOG55306.1 transposase family protein [Leptospira noguchii]
MDLALLSTSFLLFFPPYVELTLIIDGTERPMNKDLQKESYSGKKKRHTIKNLILTNKE